MRFRDIIKFIIVAAIIILLEHDESIHTNNVNRRMIRDHSDPFNLPETEFLRYFRLPREFLWDRVQELINYMPERSTGNSICSTIRILAAIRFFVSGEYQRSIGTSMYHCLGASTTGECIRDTSIALQTAFFRTWVSFDYPSPSAEASRVEFLRRSGLDNIYASVDGFHAEITALSYANYHEPAFVNRHHTHSINVLIAVDPFYRILYINARNPGSNHDAFNFRMSALRQRLIHLWEQGIRNVRLVGDSGFALEPWMLRPFDNPAPNTPQAEFNRRHRRARVIVEQTIGLLKGWMRALSGDRRLHYQPDTAGRIINCCAILHNMGVHTRVHQRLELLQNRDGNYDDDDDDGGSNNGDDSGSDWEENMDEGDNSEIEFNQEFNDEPPPPPQFDANNTQEELPVNWVQLGIAVRDEYLRNLF